MVKDIVASPVKTIIQEGNGKTVVPYLPPHPFRGMKYHRYPIFVFEQPSKKFYSRQQLIHQQPKEIEQTSPTTIPSNTTATTDGIKVLPSLLRFPSTTVDTLRTYSTNSKSKELYDRDNFNIRKWVNDMGMKPVGVHLVRCEWDTNVPNILQAFDIKERAFKKIKSEETSMFDFPRPKTDRKD